MNSVFNYNKYEISLSFYIFLYRSILEEKKYNEEFIDLFLTFLSFIIEKYYFLRNYVIESDSSFFESIKWYLNEIM